MIKTGVGRKAFKARCILQTESIAGIGQGRGDFCRGENSGFEFGTLLLASIWTCFLVSMGIHCSASLL